MGGGRYLDYQPVPGAAGVLRADGALAAAGQGRLDHAGTLRI